MLYETPTLDPQATDVLGRIDDMRTALRHRFSEPRRWVGLLARVMMARAIRGSNRVEGYDVSLDEALAAVAREAPSDVEDETLAAIIGYRDAMSYVLQLADDVHFRYEESLIRGLHFMMLGHDLEKSPGRWRPGPVFVRDEPSQVIIYTSPDPIVVPPLMRAYVDDLAKETATHAIVNAAMAHLNLAMIHPFRDGNGRMARCMQTLVLAREGLIASPFVSIEEYVGANVESYYGVLAEVGGGSWQPSRDAGPWIRWVLTAHHRQAQTVVRRANEAERRWEAVSDIVRRRALPERAIPALFNTAMGFRLRNASYRQLADVTDNGASRDLRAIVGAGLLVARGERRGRTYLPSDELRAIESMIREERPPVEDPFDTGTMGR